MTPPPASPRSREEVIADAQAWVEDPDEWRYCHCGAPQRAKGKNLVQALLALVQPPQEPPTLTQSEIRQGEENDGPLQSTDLFLQGRGIRLLVNVPADSRATYSMSVDKQHAAKGSVSRQQEPEMKKEQG